VGELARAPAPSRAGFIILAEDSPSPDGWRKTHERAKPRPWVRVSIDGARAWVGPTYAEGHACVACFEERTKGMLARPEAEPVRVRRLSERPPRPSALPTLLHEASALAVQESVFALSGARSCALLDRAADVTVGVWTRIHSVLPVAGCTVCGGPPV
jgi:bacteriocin biosynthesis cyclodehydratase domain-containing protein